MLCRVQLGECLKTIIHADYPEQWPHLLDWVKLNLSQDDPQVYAALFVLRILSRKYEYVAILQYPFTRLKNCVLFIVVNSDSYF